MMQFFKKTHNPHRYRSNQSKSNENAVNHLKFDTILSIILILDVKIFKKKKWTFCLNKIEEKSIHLVANAI